MLGITMGAVIGTEVGHKPEPVVVGDIADIQEKVGGHFDCVRIECGNSEDGTVFTLVGYVHDEGRIMEPPLDINLVASMIFNQELRGNCVILSGTNPETKEYDGENYDLPSAFYDYLCESFTKEVEKSVAFTQMLATAVGMARRNDAITEAEYQLTIDTVNGLSENAVGGAIDTLPDEVKAIMEKAMKFMVNRVFEQGE